MTLTVEQERLRSARRRKTPQYKAYHREYQKRYQKENGRQDDSGERRRVDIQFRLKDNLRSRLRQALKGNTKRGSAVRDLGCSIEELKVHLESKFYGDMTWDNYGSYWQIDHIEPLSRFDLTKTSELREATHYTNLQPLTCLDNNIKRDRYVSRFE